MLLVVEEAGVVLHRGASDDEPADHAEEAAAVVEAAFLLGMCGALLPAGILADRVDRRLLMRTAFRSNFAMTAAHRCSLMRQAMSCMQSRRKRLKIGRRRRCTKASSLADKHQFNQRLTMRWYSPLAFDRCSH